MATLTASTCIYRQTPPQTNKHIMSSRLGMNQTLASQTTASGSLRKRPAARGAPKRSGDCWDSVSIVSEHERHDAAGAWRTCMWHVVHGSRNF